MCGASEKRTYPTVSPHVGVTPGSEKNEPEKAYADARKRNRGVDTAVRISIGRTAKRNNLVGKRRTKDYKKRPCGMRHKAKTYIRKPYDTPALTRVSIVRRGIV